MKHIHLYSIIVLLLSSPAFAQKTTYLSKCGDQQETIVWQEKKTNGKIYLYVTQENEQHEYVMNKSFQTEKWKVTNIQLQTDLTIELRNNIYSLTGKFKGKSIAKTIKSNGYVWYQNIAYNAGVLLKDKKIVKYECFRPDNIKLYTMVAEAQGMEQFMGTNTNKIEVCLTGLLSAFWTCSYYFNPETLSFVGYKGVNGKPGTPETIIKIIK